MNRQSPESERRDEFFNVNLGQVRPGEKVTITAVYEIQGAAPQLKTLETISEPTQKLTPEHWAKLEIFHGGLGERFAALQYADSGRAEDRDSVDEDLKKDAFIAHEIGDRSFSRNYLIASGVRYLRERNVPKLDARRFVKRYLNNLAEINLAPAEHPK